MTNCSFVIYKNSVVAMYRKNTFANEFTEQDNYAYEFGNFLIHPLNSNNDFSQLLIKHISIRICSDTDINRDITIPSTKILVIQANAKPHQLEAINNKLQIQQNGLLSKSLKTKLIISCDNTEKSNVWIKNLQNNYYSPIKTKKIFLDKKWIKVYSLKSKC